MSMFGCSDPPARSVRPLRRLNHSAVVKTSYLSRVAEIEVADEESSEAGRQGYEDGYAEGLARAAAEAAARRAEECQRAQSALASLSSAIGALEEANAQLKTEVGTAVPKLVFTLLERLLCRELELAVDPGRDAIARALTLDSGTGPAIIRLNPKDLDTLGDITDLSGGRELTIVGDLAVEPAGALVEIEGATVDAQLGEALKRVESVLTGSKNPGL